MRLLGTLRERFGVSYYIYLLCFIFRVFKFCMSDFSFRLLCFDFCILYFGFCVSHSDNMGLSH